MKKPFSINIKTFLLKVLVIFFIGFASRILIHHCLGVNILLEYTNYISILYYLSLLSLTVYIDQIFSFHLYIPVDSFNNIAYFNNDSKITNFLFTKDYKNGYLSPSSTDHSSGHSKTKSTKLYNYVDFRPVVINGKGNVFLVPGLILDENPSSNSVPDIPPKPKPSNLSTPSTMTGLFPDQSQNVILKSTTESESKFVSDHNISINNDLRKIQSKRLTLDLAERRLKVIDSVRFNKSINKPTICDKISSGLNYVDSHLRSKLLNKPTSNIDLISQEMVKDGIVNEKDELFILCCHEKKIDKFYLSFLL
jgi:hypothetical protein